MNPTQNEPSAAATQQANGDSHPHARGGEGRSASDDLSGLDRIDFSSPDFYANAFEQYESLRAKCPVSKVVIAGEEADSEDQTIFDRPVWLVTGYELGNRALLDRTFTVDAASMMTPDQQAHIPETPEEFKPLAKNLLTVDPPEHTRLRKLVQPSFTASAIERLRPRIQQITDELLDAAEAAAAARGEKAPNRNLELIQQVAYPLPVTVICEMLGIPPEDRERTRRWSENLLSAQSRERREETRKKTGEFIAYLRELFDQKREHPGDDLISQLLTVEIEGDRLTEDEILAMVFILFVAGHVTTVNLISSGIYALLTHPSQLEMLRANPELVPNAVEEILRYYGPAEMTTPRFARDDVELDGQRIAKGEPIMVVLAAADRDPDRFTDPQAFDITRPDANRHIAFGKGVHACLGAPLARVEGQVALETIVRRYPDLRMAIPADEVEWAPSFLRGLKRLPLLF